MNNNISWRLPDPPDLISGLIRSPVGALLAQPWFDRAAMRLLTRWFFPLSRLWGTARLAEGSVEKYCTTLGLDAGPALRSRIGSRLSRFETVRHHMLDAERTWDTAFFGSGGTSPDALLKIETDRLMARNDYNALRRTFATLGLTDTVGPVGWDIPPPALVQEIYGDLRKNPAQAFAIPEQMPAIEQSRPVRGNGKTSYWLRFKSPSKRMDDQVYARVYEPDGVDDPPTLIFGHGICVEFDHWRGLVNEVDALIGLGIRVVRPEAPWHGRRVPPGTYGGERFIATTPLGALDLFTSAAREWAVLIDWARTNSLAPVAVGGSSLGAMTAQIVATNARYWPDPLHPDALFLITHCGRIEDAVTDGTLAKAWGIDKATRAAGWTPELAGHYAPLLDTVTAPVIDPNAIVTVLGRFDDVTPYASGKTLIESWNVPEENQFIWQRGHFSVPIGIIRDHKPLHRFKTVLERIG